MRFGSNLSLPQGKYIVINLIVLASEWLFIIYQPGKTVYTSNTLCIHVFKNTDWFSPRQISKYHQPLSVKTQVITYIVLNQISVILLCLENPKCHVLAMVNNVLHSSPLWYLWRNVAGYWRWQFIIALAILRFSHTHVYIIIA